MDKLSKDSPQRNSHVIAKKCLISPVLCFMGLLFIPSIMSCSKNTAIEGTPVKELIANNTIPHKERKIARRGVMTKGQTEEVRRMSEVTENRAFKEINGVPEYRIGPLDTLEIQSRVGEDVSTRTVTVTCSRGMLPMPSFEAE